MTFEVRHLKKKGLILKYKFLTWVQKTYKAIISIINS